MAAKQRTEHMHRQVQQVSVREMEQMRHLAEQRIAVTTAQAKRRIREREEKEKQHQRKAQHHVEPLSVSPTKSPSQLRLPFTAQGLRARMRTLPPIASGLRPG